MPNTRLHQALQCMSSLSSICSSDGHCVRLTDVGLLRGFYLCLFDCLSVRPSVNTFCQHETTGYKIYTVYLFERNIPTQTMEVHAKPLHHGTFTHSCCSQHNNPYHRSDAVIRCLSIHCLIFVSLSAQLPHALPVCLSVFSLTMSLSVRPSICLSGRVSPGDGLWDNVNL